MGLVNVLNLRAGGLGSLGADQIAWLKKDVSGLAASTPIVLFAHVPLWTVYPEWGWGTDDSEQALALVKRFGSVTVLNGHIHQIMQKVEGNVSFHTAMSTAFPQPTPGTAPAPGPLKVEPERLKSVLGITDVTFIPGRSALAVVDATLSGQPPAFEAASHEERHTGGERNRHRQLQVRPRDAHREGRYEGSVDQQRRCSASHREHSEQIQTVAHPRHQPAIRGNPYQAGDVRLFLLTASDDAGQDRRRIGGNKTACRRVCLLCSNTPVDLTGAGWPSTALRVSSR